MRIIKDDDLTILHQQFDNDCSIQVSIPQNAVEQALFKISKVTGALC